MQELASAYGDMEAMQATLADSAIYVRSDTHKHKHTQANTRRYTQAHTGSADENCLGFKRMVVF